MTSTPAPRTALWVSAHPRAASLAGELHRAGSRALEQSGWSVTSSDLYAQRFDPILGERDLGRGAAPGPFAAQHAAAHEEDRLPEDVRREQARLENAELLVLQFPLWWYGPPAILKGWLDRILTQGFAYGEMDEELSLPRRYGDGGLLGRRALIIVTAGEDERSIGPRGISGELEQLLFPLTHGALWYVGIESLALHVVHDADGLDARGVEAERARLDQRLRAVQEEPAVPYRRMSAGDYRVGRALREDLAPGRTDLHIHRRDLGAAPAERTA